MVEQSQNNRPVEIDRRGAIKTLASAAAGAAMPNPVVGMPAAPLAVLTSQQKASGAAALLGEVLKLAQATDAFMARPQLSNVAATILSDAKLIDPENEYGKTLLVQLSEEVEPYSKNLRTTHVGWEAAFKQLLNVRDDLFSSCSGIHLVYQLKQGCLELNARCLQLITEEFDTCSRSSDLASEFDKSKIREKISCLECREDRLMRHTDAWDEVIKLIDETFWSHLDEELDTKLFHLVRKGKAAIETGVLENLGLSQASAARYASELKESTGGLFDLFFDHRSKGVGSFNLLTLDSDEWFGRLSQSANEESLRLIRFKKNVKSLGLDKSSHTEQQSSSPNRPDFKPATEAKNTTESQLDIEGPQIKEDGDGYLLVSDSKFVLEEMSCARLLKLASDSFELTGQIEAIAAKEVVDVTRCDDQDDITYEVQFPEPAANSRDVLVAIRMTSQGFCDVSFQVPESEEPKVISIVQGEALFLLIKNSGPKVVSIQAGSFAECIFHVELFGVEGAGV